MVDNEMNRARRPLSMVGNWGLPLQTQVGEVNVKESAETDGPVPQSRGMGQETVQYFVLFCNKHCRNS